MTQGAQGGAGTGRARLPSGVAKGTQGRAEHPTGKPILGPGAGRGHIPDVVMSVASDRDGTQAAYRPDVVTSKTPRRQCRMKSYIRGLAPHVFVEEMELFALILEEWKGVATAARARRQPS